MAFGYTSSDAESEHALIVAENALFAVRSTMYTSTVSARECIDCGDGIPDARRIASPGCYQCLHCKTLDEDSLKRFKKSSIKMLDRIL